LYEIKTEIFDVTYSAYKNRKFPAPNDFDIIGLAYPGHAFNAPQLFNRFVKLLPKAARGQRAFIVKSSGEPFSPNNSSSAAVKRCLKRKGYDFFYEKHYLMPYNIMFRYPDSLAKQMYLYSQAMAKSSAKKIAEGEGESLHATFGSVIMCFLGKIEWFGAWFNGLFYRVNKKKCIGCNMCVNCCPAQNISVREGGGLRFGAHCTMCCRCTMNCPADAISMGFLNGFRVNSPYDFKKFVADDGLSANYVNAETVGYYKHFLKYYDKIDEELAQIGVPSPRSFFAPDEYAVMPKKERKKLKKQQRAAKKTAR